VADENKQAMNIRIDPDLVDALEAIRDAEGIPVSEQIRRGIRLWLEQKGAALTATKRKASRARASSRGKRA
jgi:Arc/MetJ-type ribon-helix-helix transcriptional regulator